MLIKFEVDKFRNYIKDKKDKIRNTKNIVETLIKEDQEMESIYLDEISKELEKREIEAEKENKEINDKKYSDFVTKIEDRNNENENDNDKGINKDI